MPVGSCAKMLHVLGGHDGTGMQYRYSRIVLFHPFLSWVKLPSRMTRFDDPKIGLAKKTRLRVLPCCSRHTL